MLLTPIASSADRYVWAGDRQSAAPLVEVDPGHTPVRYGALGAFGDREVELNDTLAGRLCEAIIKERAPLRGNQAALGGDYPHREDQEGRPRRGLTLHLSTP